MITPSDNRIAHRDFLKTSALIGSVLVAPALVPGEL